MNIIALKYHSYNRTYKYNQIGKEVGICINIIASKGAIAVPNLRTMLLVGIKISYHKNLTFNSTPPYHDPKTSL